MIPIILILNNKAYCYPWAGGTALQDVWHTWDAGGNLITRQDVLASETETFGYDFLDRLTSVAGPYTESYTYDTLGNMTSMNGTSYTYGENGAGPHAATTVGEATYTYDANGNMISREDESGTPSSGQQVTVSVTATPVQAPAAGNTVLITAAPVMLTNCTEYTWDVENRLTAVTGGTSFIYDGDGNRVKKTEDGQTTLYVNKYYEKNLTTGVVTTNYYLGDRLIATRENTTLTYVHQDALTGTSLTTNYSGSSTGSIKFFAFGSTRSGSVSTEQKFTGQRLDSTGLYYYGARYYDPQIGRFISADTIVPSPANPQSLNRYTYCLNNPLKYTDPSGHWTLGFGWSFSINIFFVQLDCSSTRVFDNHGNVKYNSPSLSFGIGQDDQLSSTKLGLSISLTGVVEATNAYSIKQLGNEIRLGVEVYDIVGGGGGSITGVSQTGEFYGGSSFKFGVGLGGGASLSINDTTATQPAPPTTPVITKPVTVSTPQPTSPLFYTQSYTMTQEAYNEATYQTFSGVASGTISTSAISKTGMSNMEAYSAYQSGQISYADYSAIILRSLE